MATVAFAVLAAVFICLNLSHDAHADLTCLDRFAAGDLLEQRGLGALSSPSASNASRPVPRDRIEDGYCDCYLGEDEQTSSACSRGRFLCANPGFLPRSIPASQVHDTVCDCCDGTDESAGLCPDTCGEAAVAAIEKLQQDAAEYKQALGARRAMARDAKKKLKTRRRELADLEAELKQLDKQLKTLVQRPQTREPNSRDHALFMDLRSQFFHTRMRFDALRALLSPETTDGEAERESDGEEPQSAHPPGALVSARFPLGVDHEFLPLMSDADGECLSIPWAKRRYGAFGLEEDRYVMELCPFFSATQYSEAAWRWAVKAREAEEELEPTEAEREAAAQKWSLGAWASWRIPAPNSTAGGDAPIVMRYANGDQCWNGPRRSVTVRVECGKEAPGELVEVVENGICQYEFTLRTPAACSLEGERRILAEEARLRTALGLESRKERTKEEL